MLFPLFDRNCELIGWIEPGHHIFDTSMNWIAYISDGHAWSSTTGNWIGPVNGTTCLDTNGKVFAWNDASKVNGTIKPCRPVRAVRAVRPVRPVTPVRPIRPIHPITPIGGWSTMSFVQWLTQ